MAKIWNDIEITWDGESYTIRPTMDFINKLEQGDGMSLSRLLLQIHNRDIPIGRTCEVIARTLRYAGAKVTAEDVFMHAGGLSAELVEVASLILIGCMPASEGDSKKKLVKRSAKSTGVKSTD